MKCNANLWITTCRVQRDSPSVCPRLSLHIYMIRRSLSYNRSFEISKRCEVRILNNTVFMISVVFKNGAHSLNAVSHVVRRIILFEWVTHWCIKLFFIVNVNYIKCKWRKHNTRYLSSHCKSSKRDHVPVEVSLLKCAILYIYICLICLMRLWTHDMDHISAATRSVRVYELDYADVVLILRIVKKANDH